MVCGFALGSPEISSFLQPLPYLLYLYLNLALLAAPSSYAFCQYIHAFCTSRPLLLRLSFASSPNSVRTFCLLRSLSPQSLAIALLHYPGGRNAPCQRYICPLHSFPHYFSFNIPLRSPSISISTVCSLLCCAGFPHQRSLECPKFPLHFLPFTALYFLPRFLLLPHRCLPLPHFRSVSSCFVDFFYESGHRCFSTVASLIPCISAP